MAYAAKRNSLCVVNFMRSLGCPLTSDVFEVFSYKESPGYDVPHEERVCLR